MSDYPFLVRVPDYTADETTLGEWLEKKNADYLAQKAVGRASITYEFHFASKNIADEFARNFVA